MTALQQLLSLINENIEDETIKGKLVTATQNVEGVVKEVIQSRDNTKAKISELSEQIGLFKNTLGIEADDELNADLIASKVKNNSKADEIEAKYKKALDDLRLENENLSKAVTAKDTELSDMSFNHTVLNGGLMDDFVDDSMARNMLLNQIKEQTIFKDGKIYAKDSVTGDIARNVETKEPLGADAVINNLKKTVNPMYLKPDVKTNGGGASGGTQTGGTLKRSEMSASEKGKYIKDNGQEAYLSLAN